jgi:hypothetical protein
LGKYREVNGFFLKQNVQNFFKHQLDIMGGGGERGGGLKIYFLTFFYLNFSENSLSFKKRSAIPALLCPLWASWTPFLDFFFGVLQPPPSPSSFGPEQANINYQVSGISELLVMRFWNN